MFEMATNCDRTPIVEEIETEHDEVTQEVAPAATAAEVASQPWYSSSPSVSRDMYFAGMNTLVYTLLGGSALVTLWFAFKSPSEMTAFHWHVALCMIGYQFLMPHAFLCLQSQSWAAPLTFVQRRRVHWILQLVGSVLAFVGSVIMMARKTVNFNTLHGKLALAAFIFTAASLVNGVSSLYTAPLRQYISPRISKTSHTLVGITAFVLSSACLSYGYLKHSLTEWATEHFSYAMIAITCIYTFFVIFSPTYIVSSKLFYVVKSKIF